MTNNTQYPFNLEAALAGEPVITRNGKEVLGLVDSKDGTDWPLEQDEDVEPTTFDYFICWNQQGRESGRVDSRYDLFMLNPPKGNQDAP